MVTDDVTAARVTDPREAPYPYAAIKALAEIVMASSPGDLDYTMVRLPRVLGEPDQLGDSNDVLISIVHACVALQARPKLAVLEEVTTGRIAAQAILKLLCGAGGPPRLGRGITALRGLAVDYSSFLAEFAPQEIDVTQWKLRLDESRWAQEHPQRWSIIDAWISLGAKLDGRSYSEFLASYRSTDIDVQTVAEIYASPESLTELVAQGCSRLLGNFETAIDD